ncbi:MAG: glutaminyl-peptide cyclotransferase [Chromatiales bacterium]|nr:glutaminyl-peptide cyclotransferase [Chromatiales bacterium]
MTHHRIVYYLLIASLLIGVLYLQTLYAQEGSGVTAPLDDIQVSPQDTNQGGVSTGNEVIPSDVGEPVPVTTSTGNEVIPSDFDEPVPATTDAEEPEISESEIQRIMRRMEARKNRVIKAKQLSYEVVNRFPHRPTAFTQGLVIKGDTLIESSGGYGKSLLSKVNLESGEVLSEQTMPPHIFAEGISYLKGFLYQLSYRRGVLMVYDAETLFLTEQHQYSGEGWGLTNNGHQLIMSDGSDTLRYMSRKNFEELKRISVTENGRPLKYLNELEWVDGKIYANVWLRNKIVIINPRTGVVNAYVDLKDLLTEVRAEMMAGVLNGIAYDEQSKRLYVTGKYWPTLFEIEIKS